MKIWTRGLRMLRGTYHLKNTPAVVKCFVLTCAYKNKRLKSFFFVIVDNHKRTSKKPRKLFNECGAKGIELDCSTNVQSSFICHESSYANYF